ncbi:hypothetical protein [Deinococcus sp. UYEF24]
MIGLSAATLISLHRFTQVAPSPFQVSASDACAPVNEAREDARWTNPGVSGSVSGRGSLILQRCRAGTWTFQIHGTAMDKISPLLMIDSGDQRLVEQALDGDKTLTIPVKSAEYLQLTVPNAAVVLEDRNLSIKNFRFQPKVPCLQDPPKLSSLNVGTLINSNAILLSNGSLLFSPCENGTVDFELSGSEMNNLGPTVVIRAGGKVVRIEQVRAQHPVGVKLRASKQSPISIEFTNDGARVLEQRSIEIRSAVFSQENGQ